MNESIKIRINNHQELLIDNLLEEYLLSCEYHNTKTPPCWKKVVSSLYLITKEKKNPFEENIISGIHYLFAISWNTVCEKCDDNIFDWFYTFVKAWLSGDELPIAIECSCSIDSE